MIVAAIAHIDGDAAALRRVLNAIDQDGIHEILVAGNVVYPGDSASDTVDAIRAQGARCVIGRGDKQVVRVRRAKRAAAKDDHALRIHDALNATQLEWLGDLPIYHTCTMEGVTFGLFHGGPSNIARTVAHDDGDMIFQRMAEETRVRVNVIAADGEPFVRTIGDTIFVCPGRVAGNQGAQYAVIDTDASPIHVEFMTVEAQAVDAS